MLIRPAFFPDPPPSDLYVVRLFRRKVFFRDDVFPDSGAPDDVSRGDIPRPMADHATFRITTFPILTLTRALLRLAIPRRLSSSSEYPQWRSLPRLRTPQPVTVCAVGPTSYASFYFRDLRLRARMHLAGHILPGVMDRADSPPPCPDIFPREGVRRDGVLQEGVLRVVAHWGSITVADARRERIPLGRVRRESAQREGAPRQGVPVECIRREGPPPLPEVFAARVRILEVSRPNVFVANVLNAQAFLDMV